MTLAGSLNALTTGLGKRPGRFNAILFNARSRNPGTRAPRGSESFQRDQDVKTVGNLSSDLTPDSKPRPS